MNSRKAINIDLSKHFHYVSIDHDFLIIITGINVPANINIDLTKHFHYMSINHDFLIIITGIDVPARRVLYIKTARLLAHRGAHNTL